VKILVLTNYWPPEIGASPHLTFELCASLVSYGHQVSVATGFPRYNVQDMPARYIGKLFYREEEEGIKVHRIVAPSSSSRMALVRSFEHMFVFPPLLLAGLLSGPADVVFTVSPPLPLGLSAWMVSKIRGARFVFGVQDLFPQNAIDLGLLRNKLAIWLSRRLELFIYKKAEVITVHSEGNRDYLMRQAGVPAQKVNVIPNWVDIESIIPGCRYNSFRAKHNLGDKFIVLFAGTIGWSQGLEVILEASSRLRNYEDIVFLIVGDGVEKARLIAKAIAMKLSNIRFIPMQPRDKYPLVLSAADVCLVTLRPNVSTPVVPSKLLTIMASGRPVIAAVPGQGDVPKIIRTSQCGVWVDPKNPEDLAQAVLMLYASPGLRETYGRNGRKFAETHFSREVCTKKYERLFASITGGGSHV